MRTKLLFMLTFLLSIVGVGNANAQASFNQDYKVGETVGAKEHVFLYNIGAKQFLTNGMDWGTHATVDYAGRDVTIAAGSNGWTIRTKPYSINGNVGGVSEEKAGYMTQNGYVDTGSSDDWVFTPVTVDGYTNAYTISLYNGTDQYLVWHNKNNRPYVDVVANTADANSYWLIIPQSTRTTANDYTYYLRNSGMICPWEQYVWTGLDQATNRSGGIWNNSSAEFYHKSFDIYQTVSASLSSGLYKVYCQGFYRIDGGSDATYLYANSDQKELMLVDTYGYSTTHSMDGASTDFTAGKYVNAVYTNITTTGTDALKVGIKTSGTSNWVIFDNFYVEYLGSASKISDVATTISTGTSVNMDATDWYVITLPAGLYHFDCDQVSAIEITSSDQSLSNSMTTAGISAVQQMSAGTYYISSKIDQAITISGYSIPSDQMNTTVRQNLLDAYDAFVSDPEDASNVTALNDAIAAANASIAVYEDINAYITKLTSSNQGGSIPEATLKSMSFYTKYSDGTISGHSGETGSYTSLSEVIPEYKSNIAAYWESNAPTTGTNMTSMIVNQGFELDALNTTVPVGGWSVVWNENTGYDHKVVDASNPTYAMSNSEGSQLYNNWSNNATTLSISNTISDLPNGTYTLKVIVAGYADTDIILSANGLSTPQSCTGTGTGDEVELQFVVYDGTATISVSSTRDVAATFFKADNFRLYYDDSSADIAPTLATGQMNTSVFNAQQTAYSTWESDKSFENYGSLLTSIDDATASVAEYVKINNYIEGLILDSQRGDIPAATLMSKRFYTKYRDGSISGHEGETGSYTSLSEVLPLYTTAVENYWTTNVSANADLTAYIINNGFEMDNAVTADPVGWNLLDRSSDTWVHTGTSGSSYYTVAPSTSSDCNLNTGTYLFHTSWQGTPLAQTISGLPNGTYRLSALISSGNGDGAGNVFLTANGSHSDVYHFEATDWGTFTECTDFEFVVTDGTATIGIVGGNDDGSYNSNGYWQYRVDNFTLIYLSSEATVAPTLAEGQMNTDVYNAQQTAYNAWNSNKTTGNYAALTTAIANAESSVAVYEQINTYLSKLILDSQRGDISVASLQAMDFYTKYSDGTISGHSGETGSYTSLSEVIPQYQADIADYWTINTPSANSDLTAFIVNNGFEVDGMLNWDLPYGGSADTGVRDNAGTYICEVDASPTYSSDEISTHLFHSWWYGKPLQQTIANLPNGTYRLSALLSSSDGDKDAKIFLTCNGYHSDVKTITMGTDHLFNEYTFDFVVFDGTATIGVVGGNEDGSYNEEGYWWYRADNFSLTYLSDEADIDLTTTEFTTGNMNGDVYNNLLTAYSTWESSKTTANFEALDAAIAATKESIEVYAKIADYPNRMNTPSQRGALPESTLTSSAVFTKLTDSGTYTVGGTTYTLGSYTDEASFWETYNDVVSDYWTDYVANNSISSSGVDMTAYIINQGFEFDQMETVPGNDPTGWTTSGGRYANENGTKNIDPEQDSQHRDYSIINAEGDYIYNTWVPGIVTLKVVQTLTGLPNGKYKLSAVLNGFRDTSTVNLKAQENTTYQVIDPEQSDRMGYTAVVEFYVTDGTARILAANSGIQDTFFKADNFRLTYVGLIEAINEIAEQYDPNNLNIVNVDKTDDGKDDAFKIPQNSYEDLVEAAENAKNYHLTHTESAADYASNLAEFNKLLAELEEFTNLTKINGPQPGKQYCLISTEKSDASWKDKYYVCYELEGQDYGDYSIGAYLNSSTYDENQALTWIFTRVQNPAKLESDPLDGNYYTMSRVCPDGVTRYVCTITTGYNPDEPFGVGKLRLTEDPTKALAIEIVHQTGKDGRYWLRNSENHEYMGGIDATLWTNNLYYDLALEEHDPIVIDLATPGKFGVRTLPFYADIPEKVHAYYVVRYKYDVAETENYELILEEEDEHFKAAKPYLVYTESDAASTPSVSGFGCMGPDKSVVSSSTYPVSGVYDDGHNMGLYGTVVETTVAASDNEYSRYGLQTKSGRQAFYKITSDVSMPAYRGYLQVLAGSDAPDRLGFPGEDATGISDMFEELNSGEAQIYDASGAKLNGLQKGINIIRTSDGKTKKVLVK